MKILISACVFAAISLITSCHTTHPANVKVQDTDCTQYIKNNYSRVNEYNIAAFTEGDTNTHVQFRYECVWTVFYIQQGLFDQFGAWDDVLNMDDSHNHILVWRDIKLIADSDSLYTVYTSGDEDTSPTYCAVSVMNEDGVDMLNNPDHKEELKQLFASFILLPSSKKTKFYREYWKMAAPKKYKALYGI